MQKQGGSICVQVLLMAGVMIHAAGPASAQVTGGADSLALEPVVVTTQKREESLQEAPLSITAVTGDALEARGMDDIVDLTARTPGLVGARVNGVPQISIRGIGTNDFGIGADPAVGVYIDGIYASRSGQASLDLLDIDRVEIIKGPQGTLFGRSAAAGAIGVITRKPSLDLAASAVAEYASDDALRFRGSLNGPLIDDKLAFRASVLAARRDGYTRNTEPSGGDFENASDLGGRLAATWFGGDRFEVTVAGDYLRKRGDGNGFVSTLTAPDGAAPDPFGSISSNLGARAQSDLDAYGASATTTVWLANDMTVTSITAWRGYEWDLLSDDDGTARSIAQTSTRPEKSDTYSQEFRLNGPGGGPLTWFAGVSAFREDVSNTGAVEGDLKDWLDTGLLSALTGDPGLTSLTALGLPDQPLPFVDLAIGEGKYSSYAVYGDATWQATERLELTAGLRVARDEKEWSLLVPPVEAFVAAGLADRDPSTPDILPNLLFPSTVPAFDSELSATSVQPRLVARYQFVPDASVYLSAARGYKPGGFNTFGNRPPFAAESVWSYEGGLKSELLDRRLRLNTALFRYDYEDLQVTVTGSGQLTTINAGEARGEGIEFEIMAAPLQGLTLGVTAAFLDAKYGNSSNPLAAVRLPEGNRLTRSPERQASATFDYAHAVGEGELRWSAEYFWQSEIFFDPDNDRVRHGQDSYGLLSASVSYTAPGDRVQVSLFAENALDEEYLINKGGLAEAFGFPVSLRGEPRRFGVRLNYDY